MKRCPECNSAKVLVNEVSTFFLNSGELFCHSVKAHDENATCGCYDCDWKGSKQELKDGDEIDHDLYKTGDDDVPTSIMDRNGEVVLKMCRRCGLAENELDDCCHGS